MRTVPQINSLDSALPSAGGSPVYCRSRHQFSVLRETSVRRKADNQICSFAHRVLVRLAVLLLIFVGGVSDAQVVEPVYRWLDQGGNPRAGIVQGSDGSFYGTTYAGGTSDKGTVYKISAEGAYTVLHSFSGADGSNPEASLVQGSDGHFYGTTKLGGASDKGTVFRISSTGAYTVLHSFAGPEGSHPGAALVQGTDNQFYGTTTFGGTKGFGTIFRISATGEYSVLRSITVTSGNYSHPALVQGSDGFFYGTTSFDGAGARGTIFRISAAGEYSVIHSFTGTDGGTPNTALVQGRGGYLYGTTSSGGANGKGTIFKISAAGEYSVLRSFTVADGNRPRSALLQGNDGFFYGTTLFDGASGYGTIFRISIEGEYSVLRSFDRSANLKTEYKSELVQGLDGYLYGAVAEGLDGKGFIFRINVAGEYSVFHSFTNPNGSSPDAALAQGRDGHFYGTTSSGGTWGYGTFFRITTAGEHSVLYSFNQASGINPRSGLLQGSDGNFYGTTFSGGASGNGTIFRISTAGEISVLHSFTSREGRNPSSELVEGSDGYFYGTTPSGGENNSNGTIFRISSAGQFAVLRSFDNTDGINSQAGLVQGNDGDFYGTTLYGGATGSGTIFRISAAGELAVIHHFSGADGSNPDAGLVKGNDGYLYGTTNFGGATGNGTIFRINKGGEYVVLHSFDGTDGRFPRAGLVQGNDGHFYGTTSSGGDRGNGTIFRISAEGEFAVLHSFIGSEGLNPQVALAVGSDGNLWGTTSRDAVYGGGVVYRLLTLPVTVPPKRVTYSSSIVGAGVSRGSGNTVQFEYGKNPELSSPVYSDPISFPAGTNYVTLSTKLSNLEPGTTYYYRARVSRADSLPLTGEILSFTTSSAELQTAVLASEGAAVPGAGNTGSGIPSGATWSQFGVPAFGGNSQLAFSAKLKLATGAVHTGIFAGDAAAPVLLVKRGDNVPEISLGAVFSSFKEPVLNGAGDVAFIGHVVGGWLSNSGRQGIWSNIGVSSGRPEWLVALQGIQAADAPFGAIWKAFTAVTLSDSGVISFTATLEQGRGGVTAANDLGLWQASPSGTSLLLREGQRLMLDGGPRKVKSFVALSSGQGRFTADGKLPVRVTFTDNTQALLKLGVGSEPEVIAVSGDAVLGADGILFRSFGLPALNQTGSAAFVASLVRGSAGVSASDDAGIFVTQGESWSMVARKSDVAPGVMSKGTSAKFVSFADLLINAEGQVAFVGTTTGGGKGIWWNDNYGSDGLQLVASTAITAGTAVPGANGARFAVFKSVALPDGELAGPVFVAKLDGKGITSANDVGLWAVDTEGVLRLIVREGDMVDGKVLRSFTFLSAVPGSSAQPRSYDAQRQLIYRAFFTDGSQSLVTVRLP